MLGDFTERLSPRDASVVLDCGTYLGKSVGIKDCYWSGYCFDGRFYLSLNDEDVWEVANDDLALYMEEPVKGTEHLYS